MTHIRDRRGRKFEDAIVSDSARKQRRQNLTASARRARAAKAASSAQDGTQQASQEGFQPSSPQSEPVQEGVQPSAPQIQLEAPEDRVPEYHSDAVRLLKPTAAPTKMLDWPLKDECERFKTIIANSGLADVADNSMLEHDRVAISAFVERLYPETDTFHMPFGEMTITEGTKEKEEKITLTDEQVNHAATAYLLCVLGCIIFPNTNGNRVDANLLQLMDPLEKVHEYFWGTSCHAWLMEELKKASRVGISQVAGNVSLLQAWIHDHFPILKLAIENPAWKKGDPRGTKYVFDDNHSRTKDQQLIRLREVLDSLTAQDVCFDPYKEDRAGGHIAGRSDLALYF
ncbi:protein MAINTENANCE OF MERISTEMS-like [Papaver somniferum]|uniref:protein MAINTENANCE OF MERISTEMS-like n=1 Tax=Papaver somniferum TaxID=3469 RepID=UPI000E702FC8|nr:protein MAINTENANCE OF MERISTEMS-like [Papaver somniferum]